jgi:hypothetical protein
VTNLSGVVAPLTPDFARATALLQDRCAGRLREGRVSRLVLGGRDGVPHEPGGLLLSPLAQADQEGERTHPNPEAQHEGVWYSHAQGGLEVACARWRGLSGTSGSRTRSR